MGVVTLKLACVVNKSGRGHKNFARGLFSTLLHEYATEICAVEVGVVTEDRIVDLSR